jgi:hypothetical protein
MSKPAAPTMQTPEIMQELEAAAFRRLVQHLRDHPEVQNIDLMNLAGFCRNCLSNWLEDAAKEHSTPLDRAAAREHVYGMPYEEWKQRHQAEADAAQKDAFARRMSEHS